MPLSEHLTVTLSRGGDQRASGGWAESDQSVNGYGIALIPSYQKNRQMSWISMGFLSKTAKAAELVCRAAEKIRIHVYRHEKLLDRCRPQARPEGSTPAPAANGGQGHFTTGGIFFVDKYYMWWHTKIAL